MSDYLREMLGGPGAARFYVQPAIAILLGLRDGITDARAGMPPFLLALATGAGERTQRLGTALRRILVPACVAVGASCLFQYLIRSRIHVGYALLYAVIFVAVPYALARALGNRLLARRHPRQPTHA